jgi:hypothetical protein
MAHEHQFESGTVAAAAGDGRDSGVAQVTFRVSSYVVLWLWSVLRYRNEADRWHVLLACWAGLVDAASPRVAAHLQVAMRFRDGTGGQVVPSRRPYNRWRDQQPDRDELPSASALARTFGGWPAVAEAVGMNVAPDVLARRVTQSGRRLGKSELVCVLKLWRQSNPPELTYRRYRVWAHAANHDPNRPVPWVPVSRGVFIQHFGGGRSAARRRPDRRSAARDGARRPDRPARAQDRRRAHPHLASRGRASQTRRSPDRAAVRAMAQRAA